MAALAYFCECGARHAPDCIVGIRIAVKERICEERDIISHIPEDVVQEIDQEVLRVLSQRRRP